MPLQPARRFPLEGLQTFREHDLWGLGAKVFRVSESAHGALQYGVGRFGVLCPKGFLAARGPHRACLAWAGIKRPLWEQRFLKVPCSQLGGALGSAFLR